MKREDCMKCKYVSQPYIGPRGDAKSSGLLVACEYPMKRDGQKGFMLAGNDGDILFNTLRRHIDRNSCYVMPLIRCLPPERKFPNANIAQKCWKLFGEEAFADYKGELILCVGYWAIRMLTGRELKEVHGKVIDSGGRRYACIDHPQNYVKKYVKWEKENGRWRPVPGTMEKAEKMFRQIEGMTIAVLYNDYADIRMDDKPDIPFTRVNSIDEMVNRIDAHKGGILFHDYETMTTNPEAAAKGRTALDWFYGKGYAEPMCTGFTFFNDFSEIGYKEGQHTVHYDKEKVCVLTQPLEVRVARAMHGCKIMAFNANYDTGVTLVNTGERHDIYADPMDAAYVVNQGRKKYNLASLAFEYVPELASWAGNIKTGGKKTKGEAYAKMFRPDLWKYCAGDCVISMIMFYKCLEKIYQANQEFLFWTIMCGTRSILRDMEARGLKLNYGVLPQIQEEFGIKLVQTIDALEMQPEVLWLRSQGIKWNPNSNPQVLSIYNDYLGAGLAGTGKELLKTYNEKSHDEEHTFTKLILDFRNYSKLNSTFVVGLNKRQQDGIVYASYKTNTTDTGRSSSGGADVVGLGKTNQINIQNIPRGSSMRRMYRARPGHYLAYADYSQIEVRVAGAYANSQEIYDVCMSDSDFHGMMASIAFKMAYEEVMAEDAAMDAAAKRGEVIGTGTSTRTRSKAITFGLLYGMTAEGLARRLKLYKPDGSLDLEAGEAYIVAYFAGMPSVKTFIDATHEFVKKNYHVRTVFGRMRYFEWINASALRKSVNTLVQATASDIFMLSLQAIAFELKRRKFIVNVAGDGAMATCLDVQTTGGVPIGQITRVAKPLYANAVHPWAEVHDAVTWEAHNRVPREEIKEIMSTAMLTGVRTMFKPVDEFMGRIPLDIAFKAVDVWV